ncbi:MAG TPA: LysE family translocator [Methanoculleus sp.]|nr:LysE family translocator [Methanoculleus sp.]
MQELLAYGAFAFVIGLTGAVAPGPMLVATIDASVRDGWKAGPMVVAGHMAIELVLSALVLLGFAAIALQYFSLVAAAGGVALIIFGVLSISGASARQASPEDAPPAVHPFVAGVVTSASNPYFWIWWLTIGSAFVLSGYQTGMIMAMAFMGGHWMADLGYYTLVAAATERGRELLPEKGYRLVLSATGVFLIVFGLYYLTSVAFP